MCAGAALGADGGVAADDWAVLPEAREGSTTAGAGQEDPEAMLTEEDREVIEHLELLESLDAARELELLLELSEEEEGR